MAGPTTESINEDVKGLREDLRKDATLNDLQWVTGIIPRLIEAEVRLRRAFGERPSVQEYLHERPSVQEYLQRHPEHAAAIIAILEGDGPNSSLLDRDRVVSGLNSSEEYEPVDGQRPTAIDLDGIEQVRGEPLRSGGVGFAEVRHREAGRFSYMVGLTGTILFMATGLGPGWLGFVVAYLPASALAAWVTASHA